MFSDDAGPLTRLHVGKCKGKGKGKGKEEEEEEEGCDLDTCTIHYMYVCQKR